MDIFTEAYATEQDAQDPLSHLRSNFLMPSKADLARKTLRSAPGPRDEKTGQDDEPSIYLCGNSLGLQPKLTRKYMQQYLDTWASKGVYGHFKEIEDSSLVPWLQVDDDCVPEMAKIVGALPSEVAVMQTLTANLHLMMASFYRPTKERYKIILEGKAFPSDHFYTGQALDIPAITSHAHALGITVGWDLAHAAGNLELRLHDWGVDFAVWCSYKYLNCGPGAIGGLFVHERHGEVGEPSSSLGKGGDGEAQGVVGYRTRLAGWWGSSKSSRFAMTTSFVPIPGAAGFQLSNPSVADTTALRASLDVFKLTSMEALRGRSVKLTGYLLELLDRLAEEQEKEEGGGRCFSIITPREPEQRGAQISVLLKSGLLDVVMASLEAAGVVVDERRPDVIRVAPAPMYNTYKDVFVFVKEFRLACQRALRGEGGHGESVMVNGGKEAKGWSEVK
ncbi:Kynureninase (L-kynurenine hydrolase) [Friedmanniomyces endolithicus]|nr:Kynureninase (L-kynurenine hydrolase) [Friedmanniomyces endolithicus]